MVMSNALTTKGSGGIFSGIISKIKQPAQVPGSNLPKPKVGVSMTGGIPQVSITPGMPVGQAFQQKQTPPQTSPPRIGVSSPQELIKAGLIKTDTTPHIGVSSPQVLQQAGLMPKTPTTTPTNIKDTSTQNKGLITPAVSKEEAARQAKIKANQEADKQSEINRLDKYIKVVTKPGGSFNEQAANESKQQFAKLTGQSYDEWKTGKQKDSALADARAQGLTDEQLKAGGFDLSKENKVLGSSATTPPAQTIPQVGGQGIQTPSPYTAGPDMYKKLVEGLANTPGSNQAADFYRNQIANIMATQARANKNIDSSGIDQSLALGQEGMLNRYYAALQQSAQSGMANALQQQSLQQSALQGAAGLAGPQMQFGMLTNPMTGEPLNTQVFGNAVNQAVQLVRSGADPQGSAVQGLLSPFGFVGQSAFTGAMQALSGGGYNPSAMSAATQQNLAQGAQYQGEATSLSTTLQQLNSVGPRVTNFLQAAGLNPTDIPYANESIATYIGKLQNPGDQRTAAAAMAEVKTYTAQILGSSGLNPTEVSATVNSFDPSALSPAQLQTFLKNLDNLGQVRLGAIQNTAQGSYGGNYGYMGVPSQNLGNLETTQSTSPLQTNDQGLQAALGGVLNTIGNVAGFFTNIFK